MFKNFKPSGVRYFLLLAVVFLFSCKSELFFDTTEEYKNTAVLFIIGQSNASAAGAFVRDLSAADLRRNENVFINSESGIEVYEPGLNAGGTEKFGPEIRLSKSILERYDQVLILKYTAGGTGIHMREDKFDFNAQSKGEAFDEMISQFDVAVKEARERGWSLTNVGYLWVHGEADSNDLDWATSYAANVLELEIELRKKYDWHRTINPFVVTELSIHINKKQADLIRSQQQNIVDNCSNGVLINTDQLSLHDAVHYNSESILLLSEKLKKTFRN